MKKVRKILKVMGIFLLGCLATSLIISGIGYYHYRDAVRDLPKLDPISHYHPKLTSHVYARNGELIGEFHGEENRVLVPLSHIPQHIRDAFIAAEDQNFYTHQGVDFRAIARSAWKNFLAGRVVQGGSTITQQVVKALLVGGERSYRRKIREAVLSYRIEKKFSKDRVLEIYLNNLYLGSGAYGVEAASRVYFGKHVNKLTIPEAAILAGLSKAPSRDSPHKSMNRARGRQHYVLRRLAETEKITWQEYTAYSQVFPTIMAQRKINLEIAPYFVEAVRQELVARYGNEKVLHGGLEIHTTLSVESQGQANRAIHENLPDLNLKYAVRQPIGDADAKELAQCLHRATRRKGKKYKLPQTGVVLPGIVTDINRNEPAVSICVNGYIVQLDSLDTYRILDWQDEKGRQLKKLDEVLVKLWRVDYESGDKLTATFPNTTQLQAALISIDLDTGAIRSMVGGADFKASEFNRTTQARRQAGSAIKPFIYAAAIDNGFHEVSLVEDAPIAVPVIGGVWEPKNYKREFLGPIPLRTAFAKSINTVSVRLAIALELQTVIDYFKRLGLTSPIPYHISVSLGTVDVSLIELTRSYAVFPRGGKTILPYVIERVVDSSGVVILKHEVTSSREVLPPTTAYIMTDLMKAVAQFGTGRRAKDFPRPIGGKTGTSTDYRDAWFVGYTTDVITGVWVGRDDFMPIGFDATGGRVALPIWLDYMNNGHPATEVRDFEEPENIVWWPVDPATGKVLPPDDEQAVMIPFKIGVEPDEHDSSQIDVMHPKIEDEL